MPCLISEIIMIWKCRNKSIECSEKTLIMAIINVTPDSFSDGGKNFSPQNALESAVEAQENGADIIDFGAQSTRPGYKKISPAEEWQRLEPVLKLVKGKITIPISVDTFYPYVAEKAAELGADIINDVSGDVNSEMAQAVIKSGCGWIITFSQDGAEKEAREFFEKSAAAAVGFGVKKESICFDPGIGFSKTREQDYRLIANIADYRPAQYPFLLGTSRKRVIGEGSAQPDPEKRVFGNIAADTAAILGGVNIIRLHDVKNEKQGILMADALKKYKN